MGGAEKGGIARSVSRCPPCAAGSISAARPPGQSTLPDHRSPWIRLGGSGGPASSPMRPMTASTWGRPAGESAPSSCARRRYGTIRRCAYQRPHPCSAGGRAAGCSLTASAGWWLRGCPARCCRAEGTRCNRATAPRRLACLPRALARARPNSPAANGDGPPSGNSSMTSMRSSAPSTSGTGTAPAPASQRSPFASAANASPLWPAADSLTNTARPSASVPRSSEPMPGAHDLDIGDRDADERADPRRRAVRNGDASFCGRNPSAAARRAAVNGPAALRMGSIAAAHASRLGQRSAYWGSSAIRIRSSRRGKSP